jgi:hypothetical protein
LPHSFSSIHPPVATNPQYFIELEEWLKSYKPEEFDGGIF